MAKKVAMSWVSKRKEWQKTYQGERYRVTTKTLRTAPTKEASLSAANEWWRAKQAEIDGRQLGLPVYQGYLDTLAQMASYHAEQGDDVAHAATLERASALQEKIKRGEQPSPFDDPYKTGSELTPAIWQDRLSRKSKQQAPTISEQVKSFVAGKLAEAQSGEISDGRYAAYKRQIGHFEKFAGGSKPVTVIDAAYCQEYLNSLRGQIALREADSKGKKGIARGEAWGRLQVFKQFVHTLWELKLIELPRNIDNKKFTISLKDSEPLRIPLDHAKALLKGKPDASEKTRLYLLLMANCGMTQQDISDLKPSEVDWQEGRIERQRSKTKGSKAPKVNYKLWPITFELLKKYRSDNPELVLVGKNGLPLVRRSHLDGKKTVDAIRLAYKQRYAEHFDYKYALKAWRSTSATTLCEHKDYKWFDGYFLAQAPQSVRDKHYRVPSQKEFDEALEWLGRQYAVI